jgi:hypothetical protein
MRKIRENNERPHTLHYAIFQSDDRECMFVGAKHWDVSKSDKYRQVCSVSWFGGLQLDGGDFYIEDKEEVFKILNGYYYNEESGEDVVDECHVVGYGIKEGTRKDGSEYCFRDMHSLSVGDIVVDNANGKGQAYIVDSFGFKAIEFDYEPELSRLPITDSRVDSFNAVQF